jgi:hypothetical protein
LQAHGRSDLTAKLHLLELPVFAMLLISGAHLFGIVGAALAWTMRMMLDTALLYATAWWLHLPQRGVLAHGLSLLSLATGAFFLVVYVMNGLVQLALTAVIVAACAFAAQRLLRLARLGTYGEVSP